ncbi:MAG: holo-ACP synthase [Negativicutes bacterium]|nr:holo-ACP synthase [Negativicutes bacterium]MDR3589951.1 holo-ACP synthase [Negativicutes bacterium]
MIVGVGVDMVEIERIKTALEKRRFVQRVFSEAEQVYCESRGVQRFASYAARFAGKEAVLKALGTGLSGGKWLEIEILPDSLGRPTVKLSGYYEQLARHKGVGAIHISLTHARECAVAQVVIWGGAADEGRPGG